MRGKNAEVVKKICFSFVLKKHLIESLNKLTSVAFQSHRSFARKSFCTVTPIPLSDGNLATALLWTKTAPNNEIC